MKQEILSFMLNYKNQWLKSDTIIQCCLNNLWNYGLKEEYAHYSKSLKRATIRKIIAELRSEGHLIIASQDGYMYTDDFEKITKYLKSRWCEVCREMKIFRIMAKKADCLNMLTIWEAEENKNGIN